MSNASRARLALSALEHRATPVVGAFDIPGPLVIGTANSGIVGIGEVPGDPDSTGALLADGRTILSAAHCFDENGDGVPDADAYFVRFETPGGPLEYAVAAADISIHPDWRGNSSFGITAGDVAVLRLKELAPRGQLAGYDLYTGSGENGRALMYAGYGRTGTGTTGELGGTDALTGRSYTPEVQRLRFDGTGGVTLQFNGESVRVDAPVTREALLAAITSFTGVETAVVEQVTVSGFPSTGSWEVGFTSVDGSVEGFGGYNVPQVTITPDADFQGETSGVTLLDGTTAPVRRGGMATVGGTDDAGNIGADFPAVPGASALGAGDSGGAAFLDGEIAGIASYGTGDTKFGDQSYWTRVSTYADYITIQAAAPRELLLDLRDQPVGQNGVRDAVRVFGEGRFTVIEVNGSELYRQPAGGITTLTVVGAADGADVTAAEGLPFAVLSGDPSVAVAFTSELSAPVASAPLAQLVARGAAPGAAPNVQIFDPVSGKLVRTVAAFEATFTGGVQTTLADINGDGGAEVLAGPRSGGGPVVKVFDGITGAERLSFFAYESSFRGGVNVAVGDVLGLGRPQIVVGSGVGGGPRVVVFDAQTGEQLKSFFAYEDQFRGGVRVAVADVNGDGVADIVATPGPGGGPRVRAIDARSDGELLSFFAYDPSFTGGVFLAAADLGSTGKADLITAPGANGGPDVRVFRNGGLVDRSTVFEAGYLGGVELAVAQPTAGPLRVVASRADGTGSPLSIPVDGEGKLQLAEGVALTGIAAA